MSSQLMSLVPRRFVLAGAGVGAAAGFVGCTSPASSGGQSKSGKKTLRLMLLGPTEVLVKHVNSTVLPAFKEATGYEVELQTSDWGSSFQKITTGAASNSLPDVFVIGGIWTAPLAAKGVLLDLTDRVNSWTDKDAFYPAMLDDGKYQDRQYAVPFGADVRSGIYRRDLLDQAGVGDLPTTWSEFRAAAEKVKAAGKVKSPIDWNIDSSIGLQQSFAQLFLQAGGKYFDDKGKASFSSQAGIEALTFMVETFKDGLADYNLVYSGNGPRPLTSGASALTLGGAAISGNARDNAPEVEKFLVAGPGLKASADRPATSVAWVNKFAIAKASSDAEGAWRLVEFLSSSAQMSKIAELYGILPPRKDLANQPWITGVAAQALATAPDATSQPRHPAMMQLGTTVKERLEPAIRGQVGVEETLKSIDTAIDALGG